MEFTELAVQHVLATATHIGQTGRTVNTRIKEQEHKRNATIINENNNTFC